MSEDGEQASVTSAGGLWLVEPLGTQSIFSAEQLTEEQLAFAETASAFVMGEVLPRQKEIDDKTPGVLRDLLSKAGALGLLMLDVPERFGGLGTDVSGGQAKLGTWKMVYTSFPVSTRSLRTAKASAAAAPPAAPATAARVSRTAAAASRAS